MRLKFSIGTPAFFTIAFALFSSPLLAQTDFWDGSNNNNWFNNGNWSKNHPPAITENAEVNVVLPNFARINNSGATARSLSIGTNSGETGEVRVVDDGTLTVGQMGNSGPFTIGNAGTGTVLLSDMSATTADHNNTIVGSQANSTGDLTIRDSATFSTQQLRIGDFGTGNLNIRDGAQATVTRLDVGTFNGGTGTVVLRDLMGSAFQLTVNGNASIGTSGTGTLTGRDGGSMHVTGSLFIGNNSDGVGTVILRGEDATGMFTSQILADQNIDVGVAGNGTLELHDGALVNGENIHIGRDSGSTGRVLVEGVESTGFGSLLLAENDLSVGGTQVGPGGDGELRIINNGIVTVQNNMWVWGPGSGNKGVLAIDSTYTLNVGSTLTFDGGRLHFLEDGVDFVNDATLANTIDSDGVGVYVDTDDHTGTISALLSGPGGLTKRDSGTLFLTNDNKYTGDTVVQNGVLIIDGSVAADTRVRANGTLGGTYNGMFDNVGGNLINHGVVSPGDFAGDPQTFLVTGNYRNHSDGQFVAEIGGLTEGVDSDLLRTRGDVFLEGGTLQVIRINNFMPSPGDRVTIIRTDLVCTRTGEFDTLVPVGWGLIQPVDDYSNQDTVDIVFELTPFASVPGLTPNQNAVAEGLDHAFADNCVPELTTFVGNITPLEALPHVYDLIAPEELAAIYEVGFSQAVVHNNNLQRRMDDIRAGADGYCGPIVEIPRMVGKDYNPPIQDKNVAIPDKNVAPPPVVQPADCRWGVFATGSGDFAQLDDEDENAPGYEINTGSFTAGADYRIGRHFAIGIDGGYASSTARLIDNGRIEVNGEKIGGYATVFGNGLWGSKIHVDGAVGGGWNDYDTHRKGLASNFPSGNDFVDGSTEGSEFNALIAYGADWTFGCLNIGTWSSLQYTNVSIDGFTEEGSVAPLEIQDQDQDSFRGTSGLRLSYDARVGRTLIRPELRAAWLREYGDRSYAVDARFIDCPDVFSVRGPRIGRDAALVGGGLNVQWTRCFATYVYYDGMLGRSNYNNNAVSGGLRVGF